MQLSNMQLQLLLVGIAYCNRVLLHSAEATHFASTYKHCMLTLLRHSCYTTLQTSAVNLCAFEVLNVSAFVSHADMLHHING